MLRQTPDLTMLNVLGIYLCERLYNRLVSHQPHTISAATQNGHKCGKEMLFLYHDFRAHLFLWTHMATDSSNVIHETYSQIVTWRKSVSWHSLEATAVLQWMNYKQQPLCNGFLSITIDFTLFFKSNRTTKTQTPRRMKKSVRSCHDD